MAIADKLNELITQRNNLADNLNTMGVSASQEETLTTLVPKVLEIQTGGGSEIKKGVIINECDSDGYVTSISIVGMSSLPANSFYSYNTSGDALIKSRLKKIIFDRNLTTIGASAFTNTYALQLIELPDTITSIGNNAFDKCNNLQLTKLPSNLTTISNYTFRSCTELALTELPSSITSIGNYAFNECYKLALTELPSGVTSIGTNAFYRCSQGLKTLTLPQSITSIGNSAFSMCSVLNTIIIRATTPPTLGTNVFSSTPIGSSKGYIYVPDESLETYQSATNWSTYASQIKGISELGG